LDAPVRAVGFSSCEARKFGHPGARAQAGRDETRLDATGRAGRRAACCSPGARIDTEVGRL